MTRAGTNGLTTHPVVNPEFTVFTNSSSARARSRNSGTWTYPIPPYSTYPKILQGHLAYIFRRTLARPDV